MSPWSLLLIHCLHLYRVGVHPTHLLFPGLQGRCSSRSLLLIHCLQLYRVGVLPGASYSSTGLQLYRVGVHPGASYSSTLSSSTWRVFTLEAPTHPLSPALQGRCSPWSLLRIHCVQLYRVGVHPGASYSFSVSSFTG
jgi:hypothetical protein